MSSVDLDPWIDRIYEAGLTAEGWPTLTAELEPLLRGTVGVVRYTQDGSPLTVIGGSNIDLEYQQAYFAGEWRRDLTIQALLRSPSPVLVTDEFFADERRRRTEFYSDFLRSLRGENGVRWAANRQNGEVDVFALLRPASASFEGEDQQLFAALMPHLRRSLKVRDRLAEAELASELAGRIGRGFGVCVVNADARLRHADGAGEVRLRDGRGLSVRDGQVVASTQAGTAALHRAVSAAARRSGGVASTASLSGASGVSPLVTVHPLRPEGPVDLGSVPLAVLLFEPGEVAPAPPEQVLQRLFELTPAESRLLRALVAGESRQAYLQRTGITLNTLKTHTRNLLAKTGESRTGDLVRRVLADPRLRLAEVA